MVFHILPKDNDSYMIGSCDRVDPASGVPVCETCGYRTDPGFTNPAFQLRRKHLDISCCYDGAIIVSDEFRQLYQSLGGSNMVFVELPAAPGFHHLKCTRTIALDYASMGTQRLRPCAGCGRHLDVIGYDHVALHPQANLADNEMAFSDWYFGSNNEAAAIVLCGAALALALQSGGYTGMDTCEPIVA